MRVLVTGAAGMLGTALCKILKEKSYEVYATDMNAEGEGIEFLDVRSYEQVNKAVNKYKPDIVMHLAAETDVDKCELEPDHAYLTNTIGTQNVALACQKRDIIMVYISTIGVFDGNKPEPYTEFNEPNPINVYGKSKLWGERIVQSLLRKYYIVRAGWMMGGGPRKDKKFVAKIVKQILEGKKELKIVNDKFGSLTYTVDFSKCLVDLIETGYYGLYHCTNKGYASRYEIAREIVVYLGRNDIEVKPVSSAYFPLPAPRARSEACYNYKLELLKMNNMRTWGEALKEYIDLYWKKTT